MVEQSSLISLISFTCHSVPPILFILCVNHPEIVVLFELEGMNITFTPKKSNIFLGPQSIQSDSEKLNIMQNILL